MSSLSEISLTKWFMAKCYYLIKGWRCCYRSMFYQVYHYFRFLNVFWHLETWTIRLFLGLQLHIMLIGPDHSNQGFNAKLIWSNIEWFDNRVIHLVCEYKKIYTCALNLWHFPFLPLIRPLNQLSTSKLHPFAHVIVQKTFFVA